MNGSRSGRRGARTRGSSRGGRTLGACRTLHSGLVALGIVLVGRALTLGCSRACALSVRIRMCVYQSGVEVRDRLCRNKDARDSPPGPLPFADADFVSREGRVGGVRTFEQRCRFIKQESQRWRLLLTTQVGLLRMMQFVQRSSPVKVWSLRSKTTSERGGVEASRCEDIPPHLQLRRKQQRTRTSSGPPSAEGAH